MQYSTSGAVARIVLRAPERHNAIERGDVDALLEALAGFERDEDVRVLVLTGTGPETFSSGASLRQMESGEMSGRIFEQLTDRLTSLPLPTVCALNGSVYGGGAELALSCDFRIGVRGSRLRVTAPALGIGYPVGGVRRYVRRLGLATATRILLGCEELDAEQMLACGYLTELVDPDGLEAATERRVERLVGLAPLAVRAMKSALLGAADGTVDEAEARALVEACEHSDDFREGLAAKREGRPPRFAGG